jgi:hypothetical protein
MDIEKLIPIAAWVVLVLALLVPTTYRLIRRAYLIRQHKKALPGPLLGVVYPKKTKDKK